MYHLPESSIELSVLVCLNCDASTVAPLAGALLTFDVTQRLKTAIAFEYNNDFGKYLDARMKHFNGNGLAGEAVTAVQGKLDAVKGVMVQNIEVRAPFMHCFALF